MMIEALLLGMAVGFIRGGSLKSLKAASIRMPALLIMAFVIQFTMSFMMLAGSSFFLSSRMVLYAISYGLLFVALFFNLNCKAVWLLIFGSLLNFAVIFLNGGTLPISAEALERAGFLNRLELIQSGRLVHYELSENVSGWMAFLGKRLSPPAYYPIQQVFSIGDAIISLGLFMWMHGLMQGGGTYQRAQVIRVDHRRKSWR